MKGSKSSCVLLLILLLVVCWILPACFGADENEAKSKIDQAEQNLASAYSAVSEAELVGANVSELKNKLGYGGEALAEAYVAFRVGDYENASVLAVQCEDLVSGIVDDAKNLKTETEKTSGEQLFLTAAGSIAALSFFFVLSLFGWRFLKNRYLKRVLSMKPEAGKTE
jgi:hypothetical protein